MINFPLNVFPLNLVVAFCLGSIPVGSIVARIYGVDIKKVGSGNTGASNVARNLGKVPGLITLLLDCAKGALPVLLNEPGIGQILCGLFAILGHCYSPFLKFHGGKGIATALGVFLFYSGNFNSGEFGFIALAVFIISFLKWRIVSLASLIATTFIIFFGWYLAAISCITFKETLVITLIGLVIFLRHKENIQRLLVGEERAFKTKA